MQVQVLRDTVLSGGSSSEAYRDPKSKDSGEAISSTARGLLRSLGLDTASEYLGLLDQRSLAMTESILEV